MWKDSGEGQCLHTDECAGHSDASEWQPIEWLSEICTVNFYMSALLRKGNIFFSTGVTPLIESFIILIITVKGQGWISFSLSSVNLCGKFHFTSVNLLQRWRTESRRCGRKLFIHPANTSSGLSFVTDKLALKKNPLYLYRKKCPKITSILTLSLAPLICWWRMFVSWH